MNTMLIENKDLFSSPCGDGTSARRRCLGFVSTKSGVGTPWLLWLKSRDMTRPRAF
jgi:hypothetical protein